MSWRTNWWQKVMLALYINFTWQQELLSPKLRRLRDVTEQEFPSEVPHDLRDHYRESARPMLRWWGLLMTNTRMFFLFLFLVLDRPTWFFWLEITILNLLLLVLIVRQENMSRSLVHDLRQPQAVTT